jgi:hypothetical protein
MTSRSSPATLLSGITSLFAGCLLAGCASTLPTSSEDESLSGQSVTGKPLDSLQADALRQRSLAVRTGSTPSFYADTPGRRNFGILGAIAMMQEGNRLVEDYGLQDPAGQLSEELLNALASRNDMRTDTSDAADVLLDVKTINWDFRPYRNDPDNLFVVYSARISLVDRRDGTVLASGKCRSRRDQQGDSATLDELLADGAKLLQTELREAAHECAQRMKDDTLSAFLPNAAPVAQQGQPARNPASAR